MSFGDTLGLQLGIVESVSIESPEHGTTITRVLFKDDGALVMVAKIGAHLLVDIQPQPAYPRVVERRFDNAIRIAQHAYLNGGTHDCNEWRCWLVCAVCGRQFTDIEEKAE